MNRIAFIISMAVSAALFLILGLATLAAPEEPEIVGGQESVPGAWPWQAALVRSDALNNYDGQYCAGVLIDEWWVLTAAHCVDGFLSSDVDIVLGAHNLLKPEPNLQRIAANDFIIHPDYDPYLNDSDIALIQLTEAALLTGGIGGGLPVETAALVAADVGLLEGVMSTAIGWGNRSAQPLPGNFDYPETLHEVDLPILSNELCNDFMEANYLPPDVTDNMMCAGFLYKGGRDTCYGDSGGPLMVREPQSNAWQVAGLVSWGYGCANPGTAGVSTRVSYFVPWIEEILARPKVNLVKSASADAVAPGDVLHYTLSMHNYGTESLDDLELIDPVPQGTTVVPGSINNGGILQDGVVRWQAPPLTASDVFTGEFSVKVDTDYLADNFFFSDDLEGDLDAWSVAHDPGFGESDWEVSEGWSHSGLHAWFGPNVNWTADQYLILHLPGVLPHDMVLSFWHSFDLETYYDGGVLEISTDDGATWVDLGPSILENGYTHELYEEISNPLSGRQTFSGYGSDWLQTRVDLSNYAGELALIRFRLGTDAEFGYTGWSVDDVVIDRSALISNQAAVGVVKSNVTQTAVMRWVPTDFIFIPMVEPPDESTEPPGGYP